VRVLLTMLLWLCVGTVSARAQAAAYEVIKFTGMPGQEIDRWAKQAGVLVPQAVKSAVIDQLLPSNAPAFPVPGEAVALIKFATAQKQQDVRVVQVPDKQEWYFSTGSAGVELRDREAITIMEQLAPTKIAFTLVRFPRIQLSVQPVPPRDHVVYINGEQADPTDDGTYLVPMGRVEVRVLRTGKSECVWHGVLAERQKTEVKCTF
jgi:hypothetical protein